MQVVVIGGAKRAPIAGGIESMSGRPYLVRVARGWAPDELDLWHVTGGACALGHPTGASGVRIVVTCLPAREAADANRGNASICIAVGDARAIAIKR
ncbi:MAG: hypothetical protein JKX76_00215 [Colwellia sp.]|nr:hypothetical protein [Colwellia sp.]